MSGPVAPTGYDGLIVVGFGLFACFVFLAWLVFFVIIPTLQSNPL